MLKIDVQGGELNVLKGAENSIRFIDAIYCEVSFVSLYKGQSIVDEVVRYSSDHGFRMRGCFNQSVTKAFGPTQADILFSARA